MSSVAVQSVNLNSQHAYLPSKSKFDVISNGLLNYVTIPSSIAAAASGVVSFALPNLFKTENETVDLVADYANKLAIFTNAIYGAVENSYSKNFIGTLGYSCDLISSIVAPAEELYIYRGFGSALDQWPGFLELLNGHKKVLAKFNPSGNPDYVFSKYEGFWDSFKKFIFGAGIVLHETYKDAIEAFKTKGLIAGVINPFQRAEKNLIVSGMGLFAGAFMAVFLGFKKSGGLVRDFFGGYSDLAVLHKGMQSKGKESDAGDFKYVLGSIFYTAGTILDVIYRVFEVNNMHVLALGVDRLGSLFLAWGNASDNQKIRNNANGNGNASLKNANFSKKSPNSELVTSA